MVVPGTCNYLLRKGMKGGEKKKTKHTVRYISCFTNTPKLMGAGVKYINKMSCCAPQKWRVQMLLGGGFRRFSGPSSVRVNRICLGCEIIPGKEIAWIMAQRCEL